MRNSTNVDPEDDHLFVTGAAIDREEKTRDDGIIYLQDRPVAFSSETPE